MTSQIRLRQDRFKFIPARIQKVLDEVPDRLEASKKIEIDGSFLSIFVDIYDKQTNKAYMIERPVKAQDIRNSAFLSQTARL